MVWFTKLYAFMCSILIKEKSLSLGKLFKFFFKVNILPVSYTNEYFKWKGWIELN